jgi:hypothetical protein
MDKLFLSRDPRSFFFYEFVAKKPKEGNVLLHAHPGHPSMWLLNHLDRRRMFCGDFCNAWSLNSNVW